jgi:hypothetical protein
VGVSLPEEATEGQHPSSSSGVWAGWEMVGTVAWLGPQSAFSGAGSFARDVQSFIACYSGLGAMGKEGQGIIRVMIRRSHVKQEAVPRSGETSADP